MIFVLVGRRFVKAKIYKKKNGKKKKQIQLIIISLQYGYIPERHILNTRLLPISIIYRLDCTTNTLLLPLNW
jgi:hypothetical protein